MRRSPYDILGVTPNSTLEEIKRNYRKLAKELHPDKNPTINPARFVAVNRAYEILSDEKLLKQWQASAESDENPLDLPTLSQAGQRASEAFRHNFRSFELIFTQHAPTKRNKTEIQTPFHIKRINHHLRTERYGGDLYQSRERHFDTLAELIEFRTHIEVNENKDDLLLHLKSKSTWIPEEFTISSSLRLLKIFLRGNLYGETLNEAIKTLQKHCETLAKEGSSMHAFYIAILQILKNEKIYSAVYQLSSFFQQHPTLESEQVSDLFDDKYFSRFMVSALQSFWSSDIPFLTAKRLSNLSTSFSERLVTTPLMKVLERLGRDFSRAFSSAKTLEDIYEEAFRQIDLSACQINASSCCNSFLLAGMAFQYASTQEKSVARAASAERIALQLYQTAMEIAQHFTPTLQSYINTQVVKCLSQFRYDQPRVFNSEKEHKKFARDQSLGMVFNPEDMKTAMLNGSLSETIEGAIARAVYLVDLLPQASIPKAHVDLAYWEMQQLNRLRTRLIRLAHPTDVRLSRESIAKLAYAIEAWLQNTTSRKLLELNPKDVAKLAQALLKEKEIVNIVEIIHFWLKKQVKGLVFESISEAVTSLIDVIQNWLASVADKKNVFLTEDDKKYLESVLRTTNPDLLPIVLRIAKQWVESYINKKDKPSKQFVSDDLRNLIDLVRSEQKPTELLKLIKAWFLKTLNLRIDLTEQEIEGFTNLINLKDPKQQRKRKNTEHAKALYHLYEGSVRGWVESEYESQYRAKAIEALLKAEDLTLADMGNYLHYVHTLMPRNLDGFFQAQPELAIPEDPRNPAYQSLNGLVVNSKTGELHFLCTPWKKGLPKNRCLFTEFDMQQMITHGIEYGWFSLDHPDGRKLLHPLQKMRFKPNELHGTRFLQTLFTTDYLLKFFTTGIEVSGHAPYAQRSIEFLLADLPEHLKRIFALCNSMPNEGHIMRRFWIEVGEIEQKIVQKDGVLSIEFGNVDIQVKTHLLRLNEKNELVDADDDDEDKSNDAEFARLFTKHYKEIGEYFPEFLRLAELAKVAAVARILKAVQANNIENIAQIKNGIKSIEDEIAKLNASRTAKLAEARQHMQFYINQFPNFTPCVMGDARFTTAYNAHWQRNFDINYAANLKSIEQHGGHVSEAVLRAQITDLMNQKLSKQEFLDQMNIEIQQARAHIRSQMIPKLAEIQAFLGGAFNQALENLLDRNPEPLAEALTTMQMQAQQAHYQQELNEARQALNGIERLGQQFTDIALGKQTAPKDLPPSFVPAAMRRDKTSSRLIYGGVSAFPRAREVAKLCKDLRQAPAFSKEAATQETERYLLRNSFQLTWEQQQSLKATLRQTKAEAQTFRSFSTGLGFNSAPYTAFHVFPTTRASQSFTPSSGESGASIIYDPTTFLKAQQYEAEVQKERQKAAERAIAEEREARKRDILAEKIRIEQQRAAKIAAEETAAAAVREALKAEQARRDAEYAAAKAQAERAEIARIVAEKRAAEEAAIQRALAERAAEQATAAARVEAERAANERLAIAATILNPQRVGEAPRPAMTFAPAERIAADRAHAAIQHVVHQEEERRAAAQFTLPQTPAARESAFEPDHLPHPSRLSFKRDNSSEDEQDEVKDDEPTRPGIIGQAAQDLAAAGRGVRNAAHGLLEAVKHPIDNVVAPVARLAHDTSILTAGALHVIPKDQSYKKSKKAMKERGDVVVRIADTLAHGKRAEQIEMASELAASFYLPGAVVKVAGKLPGYLPRISWVVEDLKHEPYVPKSIPLGHELYAPKPFSLRYECLLNCLKDPVSDIPLPRIVGGDVTVGYIKTLADGNYGFIYTIDTSQNLRMMHPSYYSRDRSRRAVQRGRRIRLEEADPSFIRVSHWQVGNFDLVTGAGHVYVEVKNGRILNTFITSKSGHYRPSEEPYTQRYIQSVFKKEGFPSDMTYDHFSKSAEAIRRDAQISNEENPLVYRSRAKNLAKVDLKRTTCDEIRSFHPQGVVKLKRFDRTDPSLELPYEPKVFDLCPEYREQLRANLQKHDLEPKIEGAKITVADIKALPDATYNFLYTIGEDHQLSMTHPFYFKKSSWDTAKITHWQLGNFKPVTAAGWVYVRIEKNQIVEMLVNAESGHYKPSCESYSDHYIRTVFKKEGFPELVYDHFDSSSTARRMTGGARNKDYPLVAEIAGEHTEGVVKLTKITPFDLPLKIKRELGIWAPRAVNAGTLRQISAPEIETEEDDSDGDTCRVVRLFSSKKTTLELEPAVYKPNAEDAQPAILNSHSGALVEVGFFSKYNSGLQNHFEPKTFEPKYERDHLPRTKGNEVSKKEIEMLPDGVHPLLYVITENYQLRMSYKTFAHRIASHPCKIIHTQVADFKPVKAAGEFFVEVKNRQIKKVMINLQSGHYAPSSEPYMEKFLFEAFRHKGFEKELMFYGFDLRPDPLVVSAEIQLKMITKIKDTDYLEKPGKFKFLCSPKR